MDFTARDRMMTPEDFMKAAPSPPNSNSQWGSQYSQELRKVIAQHASADPRSTQRHLGPSELGVECDRAVAGKLAGLTRTGHVSDPWPSILGRAGHTWLAEAFEADNQRIGQQRWLAEHSVSPHPEHGGTLDLYDHYWQAVVDHKILARTSMERIRSRGPGRQYIVQLLLYAHGLRLTGKTVQRVVLAAYPRVESSLDGLYIWEKLHGPDDDILLNKVLNETAVRKIYAQAIRDKRITLLDVPATPDDVICYYCPFYRPEAARQYVNDVSCPGTINNRPLISGGV